MPATGGTKQAHPAELWNKAKDLYLNGKQWAEIAALTGLTVGTLKVKASTNGWTAVKATAKAKAELEGIRPKLHSHLSKLSDSPCLSKPSKSVLGVQVKANALLTLSSAAKLVEGWQDTQQNTLVNVQFLSEAILVEPAQAPAIECESSVEPVLPEPAQVEPDQPKE